MSDLRKTEKGPEEIVAAALLVLLCVVVATQVVSRLVLQSPFVWAEEVARLLFIWLVFAGAAVALKRNKHFAVDLLVVKTPPAVGRQIERVAVVLVMAVLAVLAWKGIVFTWGVRGQRTDILEISQAWAYAPLPLACGSMLLRSIPLLRRPRAFPAEDPGV